MKKIFNLLPFSLLVLFSSNLMASNSVILKDGRSFMVTSVLGNSNYDIAGGIIGGGCVSIQTKTFTQYIEDQCALYVGENVSLNAEEIDVVCGETTYKLDKLEHGYYIRDGEKLLHKKLK